MLLEGFNFAAGPAPDGPRIDDEILAVIRAELNADTDRDVLARMRDLAQMRRMLRPETTDEEMADYLALAEGCQNLAQWLTARRGSARHILRASTAWLAATVAIIGFLTTMLIVGIAITV